MDDYTIVDGISSMTDLFSYVLSALQLFGWSNKRLWLMVHVLVSFVLKSELSLWEPREVLLSTVEEKQNVPFYVFSLYPKYVYYFFFSLSQRPWWRFKKAKNGKMMEPHMCSYPQESKIRFFCVIRSGPILLQRES